VTGASDAELGELMDAAAYQGTLEA